MSRHLTTADFVVRAKAVHGDRYDYSRARILNCSTPVEILCSEHGSFMQGPSKHASGQGCPRCGRAKRDAQHRLTNGEFIALAMAAHGDRYDYSQAVYRTAKSPVTIVCLRHGEFQQTPDNHIRGGKGCPACAGNARLTPEAFVSRSRAVHGDKYRYPDMDRIVATDQISIVCHHHGTFRQRAQHHLAGAGCPSCVGKAVLTTERFAERARAVHGEKYDYSLTRYEYLHSKVTILCPVHGPFEQAPAKHVHCRQGCPQCSTQSMGEDMIARWMDARGIGYVREWRHDGCRHKRRLPFDFRLTAADVLVEFDGPHHFRPVRYSNSVRMEDAESLHADTLTRDAIKTQWAIDNGFVLVRIRYDEDIVGSLGERVLPLVTGAQVSGSCLDLYTAHEHDQ